MLLTVSDDIIALMVKKFKYFLSENVNFRMVKQFATVCFVDLYLPLLQNVQ